MKELFVGFEALCSCSGPHLTPGIMDNIHNYYVNNSYRILTLERMKRKKRAAEATAIGV